MISAAGAVSTGSLNSKLVSMSELSSSSYGEPILENNFVIVQGRVSKHGVGTLYKTHFVLSLSAANCLTRYFFNAKWC